MKKTFYIFLALLLCNVAGIAQPFFGLGAGNKGVEFTAGAAVEHAQITASYRIPFTRTDVPTVGMFTAGPRIGSKWVVLPFAGVAVWQREDFTEYNKGGPILSLSGTSFVYGAEVNRSWYHGTVYAKGDVYGGVVGVRYLIFGD